ncbi:MAG TPA: metallothionein [Tepidisphaeraceae bacterium]|nr:metallothionein [Tepidisphaeraceae bacterium]
MGDESAKCACPSCNCRVPPGKGVVRDGKAYCSSVCAYECTPTTCLCVHDRCERGK